MARRHGLHVDRRHGELLHDRSALAVSPSGPFTLGGIALTRVASGLFGVVRMPGVLPIAGAAMLLVTAAILASLVPAAGASRVDVVQALRSE